MVPKHQAIIKERIRATGCPALFIKSLLRLMWSEPKGEQGDAHVMLSDTGPPQMHHLKSNQLLNFVSADQTHNLCNFPTL